MFGEWIWIPLIIGAVLTAASTAYGIVSSQQMAKQQADMQRAQAELKRQSLQNQAQQEEQDQLQRSMVQRRQHARQIAAAETQYAASGVTMAGTPTLALTQMSEELELEVAMEESASGRKRDLLLTDAYNATLFGEAGASLTEQAGINNAIGQGLSGAAQLGGMAYNGMKDGVFSTKTGKSGSGSSGTSVAMNWSPPTGKSGLLA